ncbi:MAG: alpha/beta hydrolase [Candidatus Marinimicrobia bacterium]|nr:alpha/beta hydrolase [Candidatus Neomarinimicrobiota bacterium]
MTSFRSKLLLFGLRYKDILKPKSQRLTRIKTVNDIYKFREIVETGAEKFGRLPKDLNVEIVNINGINAEWLSGKDFPKDKLILYFHGGGLVSGSAKSHRGIVAKFVKCSGIKALTFDYALAPEKPFPAALNDARKVYQFLLENYKPENILFMGDSGGGNTLLALLLTLKEKSLPMPVAAIALSSWTDLTNSGDSNKSNREKDKLTTENANEMFSQVYCGEEDPRNPLISPLFGDLSGLPSLLMFAGNDELMRDDTVRFAENAKKAGVDVEMEIAEGMFHCYPAVAPLIPEATFAMEKIVQFIHRKINFLE